MKKNPQSLRIILSVYQFVVFLVGLLLTVNVYVKFGLGPAIVFGLFAVVLVNILFGWYAHSIFCKYKRSYKAQQEAASSKDGVWPPTPSDMS